MRETHFHAKALAGRPAKINLKRQTINEILPRRQGVLTNRRRLKEKVLARLREKAEQLFSHL
ncbi:hypothetical protein KSF_031110 [Reticulibacter mediterranei]|uniref:Uncharacterized protein n=1 Tax=Reticulibacter mediterranei TaxID=2778369 RepID=A0A8J3IGC6_9CHLR|nr:hypothetical protein [Reticulibacter mediterranei]GHO93063.1 hypothetical protein KSF_031110 [Reticulibacter mediterranei]